MKLIPTYTRLCMVLAIACLLTGCERAERPDELQLMSDDVLKHNQGVDIQIKPLPKDK